MLKIFKVVASASPILKTGLNNEVLLWTDNWDDWFTYSTQYVVFVYDDSGTRHRIGNVKIGQFGMKSEQRRPELQEEFESIGDEFFSVGQYDEYYENLTKLGTDIRDRVLQGLGDIALDADRCLRAMNEKVTGVSLLRSVTKSTVEGQFRRLVNRPGHRAQR